MLPKAGEHFKETFAALDAPSNVFSGLVFFDVFVNGIGGVHLNFLNRKNISLAM
jgi:hypothetical protein